MFTTPQWVTLGLSIGSLIAAIIIWGTRLEAKVKQNSTDLTREIDTQRRERATEITNLQLLRAADLSASQAQRAADRELYNERFNRIDSSMSSLHEKMNDLLQLEGNRRRGHA